MRIRATATAATLLAALAASPWLAGPATAETGTIDDGSHDVWEVRHDPASGEVYYAADPDRTLEDLTSVTVRHGRGSVRLVTRMTDPTAEEDQQLYLKTRLSLSDGRRLLVVVHWFGESPYVEVSDSDGDAVCTREGDTTLRLDDTTGIARVTLDRSCLDDPRWLRASVLVSGLDRYDDHVDDYRDAAGTGTATGAVTTERLHAG